MKLFWECTNLFGTIREQNKASRLRCMGCEPAYATRAVLLGQLLNPIAYAAIHMMMIDLEQIQNGISRINYVDVRLVSRPACGIYSAFARGCAAHF